MLGDSLQGFHIIKCVSTQDDCFTGRYLQQIFESESDGHSILYKETKEQDKFMYYSLVSELFGCSEIHDKGLSFPVFSVDKCELDEILITSILTLGDSTFFLLFWAVISSNGLYLV